MFFRNEYLNRLKALKQQRDAPDTEQNGILPKGINSTNENTPNGLPTVSNFLIFFIYKLMIKLSY